ncbi:hypothetical protein HZB93_03290 [Candidatus Falkowbacteria bacterium]|nr:hypothetical protein [Candidatus Falkowbacteria bacterium]
MPNINIWTILGVIAIILLIIFWKKRSAVWGGLTIGIIIGAIVAIVYLIRGSGFNWFVVGKGAILGTIAGSIAESLGIISNFLKKKDNKK